jgi:hypothetical protein
MKIFSSSTFSIIIASIILLVLICLVVLVIVVLIRALTRTGESNNNFQKTPSDIGSYEESLVYQQLCKFFPIDSIFTNVYLDSVNTTETQVDIIALDYSGIYIFEVKNYSGYIFGDDNNKYWTQVLNRKTKYKFYSPIRQNFAHEKALERYLNVGSSKIHSIIVFDDRAKLEKTFQTHTVINFSNLPNAIYSTRKTSRCDLQIEEISTYKNALRMKMFANEDTMKQHISEVRDLQNRNGR